MDDFGDETVQGETGSSETIWCETNPEETIRGATVQGETIWGKTNRSETIQGETIRGETIPDETNRGETDHHQDKYGKNWEQRGRVPVCHDQDSVNAAVLPRR